MNYKERLYTVVDDETFREFNLRKEKEGVKSSSEYVRLILERYLKTGIETNKLVSRDRVSQNYMTLYTETVNNAREEKLLTTTMMIMIACRAKDSNRPLSRERVSKILHTVVDTTDKEDEIDSAVIEKILNQVFKN